MVFFFFFFFFFTSFRATSLPPYIGEQLAEDEREMSQLFTKYKGECLQPITIFNSNKFQFKTDD